MTKKPTLAAALQNVSTNAKEPARPPEPVENITETERAPVAGHGNKPPSRRGKKTIAGHFDPAVSRQLHQLALEHDKSLQDMVGEALNDLFVKYGKSPIA